MGLTQVKRRIRRLVRPLEATIYPKLFSERDCLVAILLHGVFRNGEETLAEQVDPQEYTTVDRLRRLIEYFLHCGYAFLAPSHIGCKTTPGQRCLLLTFDDGYASFLHVLPLLDEYGVPATLFPVTRNSQEGRCYWWDVYYRERRRRGVPQDRVYRESVRLQGLRNHEIERRLVDQFGRYAFRPTGDVDRPLSVDELKYLGSHPRVTLGNHTAEHANLVNYDRAEVEAQITGAQRALAEITGKEPSIISYPFGSFSPEVIAVCRTLGLEHGLTVHARPNRIPGDLDEEGRLTLGRFSVSFRDPSASPELRIRQRVLIRQAHDRLFGRRDPESPGKRSRPKA